MKKVFKGWVGSGAKPRDCFYWAKYGDYSSLTLITNIITKPKGNETHWGSLWWPPKRVTITVEIED